MQYHWSKNIRAALFLWAAGFLLDASASQASIPSGITVEQIVERVLSRAQIAYGSNRQTNFAYDKTTVTEELDGKGRVTSRKEKVLAFDCGVGTLKELKINGKPASDREIRKIEAERAAERQRAGVGHASRRDDNWSQYLNKELVSRFVFELVGQEEVAGRAAYILTFEPKSDKLPVKQTADRLVNRVAGKVWVDTRDFEVAKAKINLLDEITMWGGVLGAMKKFSFDVERTRAEGSVWFNRVSNFEVQGRKLFDGTHIRVTSESSNFRKATAFK